MHCLTVYRWCDNLASHRIYVRSSYQRSLQCHQDEGRKWVLSALSSMGNRSFLETVVLVCSQDDPFWTAGALSASDYVEAGNQSVCKLEDMLQIIKDNTSLILNFQNLPPDHPYHSTYINITLETILMSGIQQQAVSCASLCIWRLVGWLLSSMTEGQLL